MDAAGGGEGREREGVREGGWFFQSGRGGERHEEVLGGLPRPRDLGAQKAQARTDDGRVKDARNVPHTRPHLLVARVQDVQHAVRAGNVQTVGKLVRGFGHAARRHFRAVLRSMAWPKKWSARALGLQVRKGGRALSPRSNGGDGGRVGAKGGAMRAFLLRLDSPPQSTTTGFFSSACASPRDRDFADPRRPLRSSLVAPHRANFALLNSRASPRGFTFCILLTRIHLCGLGRLGEAPAKRSRFPLFPTRQR